MAGLVTKETNRSVENYIKNLKNTSKEKDSYQLIELMESITGNKPKVWGNSKVPDFLIGFGKYTYQRKGSKEKFEWFNVGFAPRKTKITIYLTFDITEKKQILEDLGKCKWGKGCLYINKLSDINLDILQKLIIKSKDLTWH